MRTGEKVAVAAIVLSVLYFIYFMATGGFSRNEVKSAAEGQVTVDTARKEDKVREVFVGKMNKFTDKARAEIELLNFGADLQIPCQFLKIEEKVTEEKVVNEIVEEGVKEDSKVESLEFTSFLGMEKQVLAVINGVSYKVGEKLLNLELIVKSISSDFVIVNDLQGKEYKVMFVQEKK